MKKYMRLTAWLILILMITSCSAVSNLVAPYSLSESELNHYLKSSVRTPQQFTVVGLMDVTLYFEDLKASIGREQANKISLSGQANLKVSSLFGNQSAAVKMKISALPYFDSQQGAIYLKDIDVHDYSLVSPLGSESDTAILPYLGSAIQYYLNHQPVYILDPDNGAIEDAIRKTVKYIRVEPGRIIFETDKKPTLFSATH